MPKEPIKLPKIKLVQVGNIHRGEPAWQWFNEHDKKPISPYISDSDVAEKWGKIYLQSIEEGKIKPKLFLECLRRCWYNLSHCRKRLVSVDLSGHSLFLYSLERMDSKGTRTT
jgi:hypothetical protein